MVTRRSANHSASLLSLHADRLADLRAAGESERCLIATVTQTELDRGLVTTSRLFVSADYSGAPELLKPKMRPQTGPFPSVDEQSLLPDTVQVRG